MIQIRNFIIICFVALCVACSSVGQSKQSSYEQTIKSKYKQTIAYAGITFSGSKDSDFKTLYPYSYDLVKQQKLHIKTFKLLRENAPDNFTISPKILDKSSGYKYALTLMIDDENILIEKVDTSVLNKKTVYEVVPYISAQLILFDVETSQYISSLQLLPISSEPIHFTHLPTDSDKSKLIAALLTNDKKSSLLHQFVDVLKTAEKLKRANLLTVSVGKVVVENKALHALPPKFKLDNNRLLKPYIAQRLLKNLAINQNVATQPYGVDASTLAMRGRFIGEGSIYRIEMPKPAYLIDFTLRGFKKQTYGEQQGVGKSDIYATFSNLKINQNGRQLKTVFEHKLKAAVVKEIPDGKALIDDWAAFRESFDVLMHKSTTLLHNPRSEFYKNQNFSKKAKKQISALQKVYEKCRL